MNHMDTLGYESYSGIDRGMIIKSHLCGIAVAFDRYDTSEPDSEGSQTGNPYNESLGNGRYQGSLYSQQKRKIADACEYMRLNAEHKPIIFVATSPGFTDLATEGKLIQKLTHNLKNGYSCKNYVWVREFTQAGFPHFHFVADMPDFDIPSLTAYWSGLFGSDARNSIRLGTAPNAKGKREFYLKRKQMCFYLTKYLGKAIGACERGALKGKRSFRTFAVSQELGRKSKPVEFRGKMARTGNVFQAFTMTGTVPIHEEERVWQIVTRDAEGKEVLGDRVLTDKDAKQWNWRYTGFANTFKGYPKEWKLKPKQYEQPKQQPAAIEAPF